MFSAAVFLEGVATAINFAGSGGVSALEMMFLVDLRRSVTDGGFVTKLSALIRAELGSLLGHNLVCFLATGLLSSSLFVLVSSSYETFKLTLRGSLFCQFGFGFGLTLDLVLYGVSTDVSHSIF